MTSAPRPGAVPDTPRVKLFAAIHDLPASDAVTRIVAAFDEMRESLANECGALEDELTRLRSTLASTQRDTARLAHAEAMLAAHAHGMAWSPGDNAWVSGGEDEEAQFECAADGLVSHIASKGIDAAALVAGWENDARASSPASPRTE